MKIGIRGHDIGRLNSQDFVATLQKNKIEVIQLVLNKALLDYQSPMTVEKAKCLAQPFINAGIEVAMLGAYFNPIHSNKEVKEAAVLNFKAHLLVAELFKTKYVGSETGSYQDDRWIYHPYNETEAAYQKTLAVFQDLVKTAQSVNKSVAIEGAFQHVISTPSRLKRLVDDLNSDHVNVIVDLFNYLDISNHTQYKDIFLECMALLKDKIVIFHLKNYLVVEDKLVQVSLEKGNFDYQYLLSLMKKHCPEAYLILEGITGEDIKKSIDFVTNILKELPE